MQSLHIFRWMQIYHLIAWVDECYDYLLSDICDSRLLKISYGYKSVCRARWSKNLNKSHTQYRSSLTDRNDIRKVLIALLVGYPYVL
jgi:hypothetical protein